VCLLALLLTAATPAMAQEQKIYLDFRLGASHISEDSYSRTSQVPFFQEAATSGVNYAFGTGGHFDFGGGYMFTPVVGVGVNVTGDAYEGFPGLSVTVPSPVFFNTFASDTTTADRSTTRSEAAFHPQVMINTTPGRDLRIRVFGGPSFFVVEQDLVDTIRISQQADTAVPTNTVRITGYDSRRDSAGGVGFHLAGDVSYFFKRTVGAGGYVSFWRGTAELEDSEGTFDATAGGVSYGGMINFRF
jgi:hypothetical protein